ncbi:transcriptional regulator, LysR family [Roseateles sp. YR242]|uniref:LysR family transcriptional regulator n=1 Tax=Roseateles sp. YR242 TaxID=1855305 RepID=UPI0008CBCB09|nr:LysR family transcriptional regulator [Roseateles sp. YR242]SEK56300.1 transcriptional regulator, LysR family [Roseateles sp. YR242]
MNDATRDLGGLDRLSLLQTFLQVVEAGSFSAAAQQLGTTQPTVSRRLQMLESLLGARLVERSTRGLRLTEEGRRCLAQARSLIDGWNTLSEDLGEDNQPLSGRLRVRVPHAFGQHQLMEVLAGFMKQHPGLTVEWMLQDELPDFSREAVDCAVVVGHVERPELIMVPLAEVPRVLVAAPELAGRLPADLDQRSPAEIADSLQTQSWLALTTFYREEIRLRPQGGGEVLSVPLNFRFGTDSLFALIEATRQGLGLAAVSHWAVMDDLASGRLVRLLPQWCAMPLPFSLVFPSRQHQPARLRAFAALMREVVPGIRGMRAVGGGVGLGVGGERPQT